MTSRPSARASSTSASSASGPPGMRLAVVEVGDVGGRAGTPADLDRLAERVEVAVAERVAHVGVIEAAGPTGLLGERGEFLGRGVAAGRVVEAGATGRRRPRPSPSRSRPRIRSRVAGVGGLVVPADRADPERGVADERGDVEADRAVVPAEVALDGAPRRSRCRGGRRGRSRARRRPRGRPCARTARTRCRRRRRPRSSRPGGPWARAAAPRGSSGRRGCAGR